MEDVGVAGLKAETVNGCWRPRGVPYGGAKEHLMGASMEHLQRLTTRNTFLQQGKGSGEQWIVRGSQQAVA